MGSKSEYLDRKETEREKSNMRIGIEQNGQKNSGGLAKKKTTLRNLDKIYGDLVVFCVQMNLADCESFCFGLFFGTNFVVVAVE